MLLVGRDPVRLDAVRSWIAGQVPHAVLLPIRVDLSLLSDTRQAAEQILSVSPSPDILVNNAGTLSARRTRTIEGHELTLAVNHLAPFMLTRALLPGLAAGRPGRVVMVGSSTSDHAAIDPDNLELEHGWFMSRAYARSKLALLMTSIETAERVRGSGVTVNVVHPGVVATGLVRSGGIAQLVWKAMARVALTEQQGADTPLHVALSPTLDGVSGCYLKRRAVVTPNRRALDPLLRARVMAATEQLAGPA